MTELRTPNPIDTIRVLDLETCGLPERGDGQIVEVATLDLVRQGDGWVRGRSWSSLVNPGRPIPPEASAIHHLTDADVENAPRWDDVLPTVIEGNPVFAAHNAKFERACWNNGHIWICSYKVGVLLWPESPTFSNQCLRYFLKLKLADPAAAVPHRAAGDVYVTAAILRRAFMDFVITPDDMVATTNSPVLLPRLFFGQHAMKPITDVPTGYLEWMARQTDMDEDAVATARHHLHKRREASRSRSPVQLNESSDAAKT